MTLKKQSVRASVVLTSFDAISFGCSLVRNMILARMLAKADFGLAATLAMIISLLEFSAKMGVPQCVIRDQDGDSSEFLATAHFVQFGVAAASAVIIFAAAWPLARFFGIPDHAWAVAALGLVPLLRGCEHMDVRRFERNLLFVPSSLCELIPQLVTTIAAWPASLWFGDYRAVLVLLLGKSFGTSLCSHLFAERPYRWRVDRLFLSRIVQFGWPLVLTGFVMFGVMQGEQFAIASFYAMSDVAPYAAAAAVALMPVFFFGRVFGSVLLPLLASVQNQPAAFRRRYRQVLSVLACLASSTAVGFILGGEAVMRIVYGEKYAGAGLTLAALGAAGALRTVRASTAIAALAKGDSRNELYSNGARWLGFLVALGLAWHAYPIWMVACSGLVGEAAAIG